MFSGYTSGLRKSSHREPRAIFYEGRVSSLSFAISPQSRLAIDVTLSSTLPLCNAKELLCKFVEATVQMQLRKFNYVSALFLRSRIIARLFGRAFMLSLAENEHLGLTQLDQN